MKNGSLFLSVVEPVKGSAVRKNGSLGCWLLHREKGSEFVRISSRELIASSVVESGNETTTRLQFVNRCSMLFAKCREDDSVALKDEFAIRESSQKTHCTVVSSVAGNNLVIRKSLQENRLVVLWIDTSQTGSKLTYYNVENEQLLYCSLCGRCMKI